MFKSIWQRIIGCIIKGCRYQRDYRGHHQKHRATGGSDGPWNRLPFCRFHHTELHQIGKERFIEKYPETKLLFERAENLEFIWQQYQRGEIGEHVLQAVSRELYQFAKKNPRQAFL